MRPFIRSIVIALVLWATTSTTAQGQIMSSTGGTADVHDEVGDIIVANVDADRIRALVDPGGSELEALIAKRYP